MLINLFKSSNKQNKLLIPFYKKFTLTARSYFTCHLIEIFDFDWDKLLFQFKEITIIQWQNKI